MKYGNWQMEYEKNDYTVELLPACLSDDLVSPNLAAAGKTKGSVSLFSGANRTLSVTARRI
jgi:hypothetical protein